MVKCPVCSATYVHEDKCTNKQLKLEEFKSDGVIRNSKAKRVS